MSTDIDSVGYYQTGFWRSRWTSIAINEIESFRFQQSDISRHGVGVHQVLAKLKDGRESVVTIETKELPSKFTDVDGIEVISHENRDAKLTD